MDKELFKNKKLIIIAIIVVLIIGICFIVFKFNNKQNKEKVLTQSGFGTIYEKSSGKISSSEVSKFLKDNITNYLPNMYNTVKKYNNKQLEKYYDENYIGIKNNLGKNTYKEYLEFIQKLKSKNININKWNSVNIIKDSFEYNSNKENYAYLEYEVNYSDESIITFSLYIEKQENNLPVFIVDIIK